MRWSMFEKHIRTEQLTVIPANGEQRTFGCGEPHATIEFTSADCLSRLLRNPQLNLGETYMQGGWSPALDSDLYAVLLVLRLNFEQPLAPGAISWPLRCCCCVHAFLNSLTASRRNVSHHYDLDEALFRACLDTDLHYSCAYFTGLSEPLEAAQKAKCEHIARKLYLRPGQKGWISAVAGAAWPYTWPSIIRFA